VVSYVRRLGEHDYRGSISNRHSRVRKALQREVLLSPTAGRTLEIMAAAVTSVSTYTACSGNMSCIPVFVD